MENLYEILNISKDADEKGIKKAYTKMLRKYPPEKNPEEFKKVREAYETLINRDTRVEYDAFSEFGEIIQQHSEKANEAMEKEDYKVAIKEYKKILIIEPSLAVIKNRLGLALLYDGQIDLAQKQFIELVNKYPDNAIYTGNLAYVYKVKRDFIKSEQYYIKAHEIDSINDQIIIDLVELYIAFEKYKKAIILLEGCLGKNKSDNFQDFIYYFKMIRVYIFENNIDKIEQVINKIESMATDDESREYIAWECGKLAYNLLDAEIYSLAEKISKRAIEIHNSESIEKLYQQCKDYNEDYSMYDKLAEDDRITAPLKGPIYYYLYGHKYEDESEYEEDLNKNTNAIQSYLTYEYSSKIVDDINILRREYNKLYKYKQELYDNINTIATKNKNINNQYVKIENDYNIPNGFKRLIALWMADNLSQKERDNYFENIMDEISQENLETLDNALSRIRSNYNLLYNLNSKYFEQLKQAVQENLKETTQSRQYQNNNYETTQNNTSSSYQSNSSTSSNSGCGAIVVCTIIGTMIAPGIGTVIGFFIGCGISNS